MSSFQFMDNNEDDDDDYNFQWGGRDASIFLVDCSKKMLEISDEEDMTYLSKSLKCACSTASQKIISSDQDLYAIILFNTAQSKNSLDFSNIYILQDLQRPGAERIIELEKLIDNDSRMLEKYGSTEGTSIHDLLWVCRSHFADCSSKLMTKNVLLFTCEDNPHEKDEHKKRQAFKGIRDLYEGGIEFEILPLGTSFDVNLFYKELLTEGIDEENKSLSTLADPTDRFEELLERVRKYEHKQRSTGRVSLAIAPGVELGVKVFTSIRKMFKPSKVKLYKVTNEELVSQKREMLDTGAFLMPSDLVKYQTYGDRKIKFTLDEVRSLSKVYETGIEILGFKPMSYFKPFLYVKPASFIYPDETSYKGSRSVFACLLNRCLAKNVCPVVRVGIRQGSSVAMAFLLPQQEEKDERECQKKPPGFHICYLPFADDFRSIDMNDAGRAHIPQVDAAKEILKKLRFSYTPESFENPDLQTHWRNIETLALHRATLEEVTDYTSKSFGPYNSRR